jgi:hypothetical protein
MFCPLPVYMRFQAAIFAALSRPRRGPLGEVSPDSIGYSSLSGAGQLVGVSAFRPSDNTQLAGDAEAPWNLGPVLKWQRRTQSAAGAVSRVVLANGVPYGDGGGSSFSGTGFQYIEPAGNSASGSIEYTRYSVTSFIPIQPGESSCGLGLRVELFGCTPPVTQGYFAELAQGIRQTTATLDIITFPGVAATGGDGNPFSSSLLANFTIQTRNEMPDSFFAALIRAGGLIAGESRESLPGIVAITTPESLAPLPFSAVTAVRATPLFRGLVVGGNYTLRAWYHLRGLDGRADTTLSADSALTATASTQTVVHHLPVIPGYGVSLADLRLFPAA